METTTTLVQSGQMTFNHVYNTHGVATGALVLAVLVALVAGVALGWILNGRRGVSARSRGIPRQRLELIEPEEADRAHVVGWRHQNGSGVVPDVAHNGDSPRVDLVP
jgi:hypothetical protein